MVVKMKEYTYQWNPQEDEPILKITKSSYGSFKWCPKKYEFSYIERLPQDTSEAMIKGTVVHNTREEFFDIFDVKKAENLSYDELVQYNIGLHPVDEYGDIYKTMSSFEAQRFVDARDRGELNDYLPVINEVMLDAQITIPHDINSKAILLRDYTVHLQGIIDRMFRQGDNYIPIELKTGPWKDYKLTGMRAEMSFYKLLMDNATDEYLAEKGIERQEITHWGWYYPVSNYIQVEPVKKTSMNAVMKGIAKLIYAYERNEFPEKYYYKTCEWCSFKPLCPAAQKAEFI